MAIKSARTQLTGFADSTHLLKPFWQECAASTACTHKIGKLESEGDLLYRREVASLFENVENPVEIIKWKDILEYLENTLDHCEDVSDMIRGVVMKYA